MTETIEVFFKNENNAESAQAQLRTLKVIEMYIEEMPEDARTTLYVPVFPASLDTNTTGSARSEEHTSELQSRGHLVCRLVLEKKKIGATGAGQIVAGFWATPDFIERVLILESAAAAERPPQP